MNPRRFFAPALAAILIAAVGGGIWHSHASLQAGAATSAAASADHPALVTLHGLIGSEKENFFADPRVRKALAAQGLAVVVEKAGSRTIAGRYDPAHYDFGFPSGAPAAQQLKASAKAADVYTPFYTPIAIASWRPIAEILVANGIVRRDGDLYSIVDLAALLALVQKGTRWSDLKHSQAFATGKSVIVTSTDVRTSNSAEMYLALASYLANHQQIVQSQEDVDRVLPIVAPLFLRQGFVEQSSAGPFEDYLALGMGKAPLLVVYESQLVEFWLRHPDKLRGDMVLLYPHPTIFSKHVLVPYTPAGARLGVALTNDPALRDLEQEYGFRTGGDVKGPEGWARKGVKTPDVLLDVIDPPNYDWLERMIQAIETRLK